MMEELEFSYLKVSSSPEEIGQALKELFDRLIISQQNREYEYLDQINKLIYKKFPIIQENSPLFLIEQRAIFIFAKIKISEYKRERRFY